MIRDSMLDFGGIQYAPIPPAPSRDDARKALVTLKDPLCDVPFAEPWHLSATLAMVLTLVCRHYVQGPRPLGGITAHGQGAGKGLLATVIALIGTGRPCAFWPQPTDEAEEKKRLLAIGLQGDSVVCIDNVTTPFRVRHVCQCDDQHDATPTASWACRRTPRCGFHCVWLATGNNLTYVGDMARRRVVPIIIDPKMERPEERTGFRYPDLPRPCPYPAQPPRHRGPHHHAGLCPGRLLPADHQAYGSFDDWYQKIAGALMWLGEPDPCEGRKALQAEVEDELLQFPPARAVLARLLPRHAHHPTHAQAGGV